MGDKRWILYGANGYMGKLIVEEAARRGMTPILAGRRESAIRPMAERFGLEHRVFGLESAARIAAHLEDVDAVLLLAGPFSGTSAVMVEACIASRTTYLDISGEVGSLQRCFERADDARQAGCVLLPGAGFDVVPFDCLARSLAEALPGADRLELALTGGGTASKGSFKAMIDTFPEGGALRESGVVRKVPVAWKTRKVPFRGGARRAVLVPWGDVVTSYFSTGIPNIEVYMAMPRPVYAVLELLWPLASVLRNERVKRLLHRAIDAWVQDPDEATLSTGRLQIWGRVAHRDGRAVEGTLETQDGYVLTMLVALESMRRVLREPPSAGAHTPATAFGADYIRSFDGCDLQIGPILSDSRSSVRPTGHA